MTEQTPDESTAPAHDATTAEPTPEQTEEPAAEPGRRTARSRILAFGVLPAVVVLLVAAAAYLGWRQYSLHSERTAATESVQAAKDIAIAILSYEPAAVDQQLVAARDRLTGEFRETYIRLTDDVVIPGAKEKQITAVATVPAAATVSADTDQAVVLLFVDQTVTIGGEPPTNTKSSVRVGLSRVDGRWLVSEFRPV